MIRKRKILRLGKSSRSGCLTSFLNLPFGVDFQAIARETISFKSNVVVLRFSRHLQAKPFNTHSLVRGNFYGPAFRPDGFGGPVAWDDQRTGFSKAVLKHRLQAEPLLGPKPGPAILCPSGAGGRAQGQGGRVWGKVPPAAARTRKLSEVVIRQRASPEVSPGCWSQSHGRSRSK